MGRSAAGVRFRVVTRIELVSDLPCQRLFFFLSALVFPPRFAGRAEGFGGDVLDDVTDLA